MEKYATANDYLHSFDFRSQAPFGLKFDKAEWTFMESDNECKIEVSIHGIDDPHNNARVGDDAVREYMKSMNVNDYKQAFMTLLKMYRWEQISATIDWVQKITNDELGQSIAGMQFTREDGATYTLDIRRPSSELEQPSIIVPEDKATTENILCIWILPARVKVDESDIYQKREQMRVSSIYEQIEQSGSLEAYLKNSGQDSIDYRDISAEEAINLAFPSWNTASTLPLEPSEFGGYPALSCNVDLNGHEWEFTLIRTSNLGDVITKGYHVKARVMINGRPMPFPTKKDFGFFYDALKYTEDMVKDIDDGLADDFVSEMEAEL